MVVKMMAMLLVLAMSASVAGLVMLMVVGGDEDAQGAGGLESDEHAGDDVDSDSVVAAVCFALVCNKKLPPNQASHYRRGSNLGSSRKSAGAEISLQAS